MIERNQWIVSLNEVGQDKLLAVTSELSQNLKIRPKAVSQSGLGMLKLEDSAYGEPFYLGEIPFSSAWLEIETEDGVIAEGAAQIMDDQIEVVEAMAICDAILANQLMGWEQILEMVDEGAKKREDISRERKTMLASTQVDFSLLDEVED
jgi:alpha-D-ribose 1-methylphosphonate 5-triphosphate synthase subunit PhnG